jgi:hypothetical protein
VLQLFIDFKKAYDSVKWEGSYNILIEFGIPLKLVRLLELHLNETYSRICASRHLSDMFLIYNVLKPGDYLLPLFFNLVLEYAIWSIQVNQESFKLKGTHQLLVYAHDVRTLGGSIYTITENTEALLVHA